MDDLIFHWSGGKDSMLALYYLLKEKKYRVTRLVTNFSKVTKRVTMHGVQSDLMKRQAESLSLPLDFVFYDAAEYNEVIGSKFREIEKEGVTKIGYGDIFLEDLKKYRDEQLEENGLSGVYPLWRKDSNFLVNEFIELGFKAIVVCVNGELLDESFVGRILDKSFVADLPPNIDPCGENGEFHTYVYDGPIFNKPIKFTKGAIISQVYPNPISTDEFGVKFWFCDLKLK